MKKYKAVIFDLDGTILDTLDDLTSSVNHALSEHGMTERTKEEVRAFVGNGIANLIKKSVSSGCDEMFEREVLRTFTDHYMEHCNDMTGPYDGICDMLDLLRGNDIKCAVLSNKADKAVKALCDLHFKDKFRICVGEREGVRRKPCADGVYSILKDIGESSENVLYVGDSEVDVLTAENAGIDMVAVSWGFRDAETLQKSGAKTIVSSIEELKKCIL